MRTNIDVTIDGHLQILDLTENKMLVDKHNAVHPQNMSRIIARALAHEDNSWIFRMAFGNGGSTTDAVGNVILNPPNVDNWQSTLYHETYSEVVDELSSFVGLDLGSSDTNNTRPGGGADPSNDLTEDSTVSQEVGIKSNVIISCYLNQNEPSGESPSAFTTFTPSQNCFVFDEIGLYSPGLPSKATNGITTINVGNKTSDDIIPLTPSTSLTLHVTIDGTSYSSGIAVPASGSGPSGQITFGDFCEGLNTGLWYTSNNLSSILYVYITDNSNGTYPTILNAQSYGFLIFQSKTFGSTSTVSATCFSGDSTDLLNVLTGGVCSNCNIRTINGLNAGVQNDPITPANERERLLTHVTFEPIPKSGNSVFQIVYTLTVSVAPTQDSVVEIVNS